MGKGKLKLRKVHEKYIRWTLGLDFNIPAYLLLEETKRKKLIKEIGKRAVKYEE